MLKNKKRIGIILGFCVLSLAGILLAEQRFVYDPKGRRNPFVPLVTPDGRLVKLEQKAAAQEGECVAVLEGIIYDKFGLSYAIVNGKVVKIGDKIGDYQVLKIFEQKIILIKEGVPLEVELKKEEP